ncbi:MAG: T9SS type A sorting domain-containing protein [Bacteroidetes bacterium]|nr:T9SS type A sorting domain-containing protein [Bacteroidota bacterium]
MKKTLVVVLLTFVIAVAFAQHAPVLFGGTYSGNVIAYHGGDTSLYKVYYHPAGNFNTVDLTEAPDGRMYGCYNNNNGNYIAAYDPISDSVIVYGVIPYISYSSVSDLTLTDPKTFYGVTTSRGAHNSGIIFKYTIGTTEAVSLFDFPQAAQPYGGMTLASDGRLYGMTSQDGDSSAGTIYRFDQFTNTYTRLYSFPSNSLPHGKLLEWGRDTLYGMTTGNGTNNRFGTIFRYVISSGSLSVLYNMAQPTGSVPFGSLTAGPDRKFYGLALGGGRYGGGVLFRFDPVTMAYDSLHSFGSGSDGKSPYGSLMLATDGKLYGTTYMGGDLDRGTIFSYDVVSGTYTQQVRLPLGTLGPQYGTLHEYFPKAIHTQPYNTYVCEGYHVHFTASDTAASATVQWQVSADSGATFSNIAGATDTILRLLPTTAQNGSQYRAIFTHGTQRDTTLSADLTVFNVLGHQSISICAGQSISVYGHQHSTAGVYRDTVSGISSHQCDSIIETTLTISGVHMVSATICAGHSYTTGGQTYDTTGTYDTTLPITAAGGCDSVDRLVLTVLPYAADTTLAGVCAGSGGYLWHGGVYDFSGIYIDTLSGAAVSGCDSFSILVLAVVPNHTTAYFSVQPAAIPQLWYALNQCAGPSLSYVWNWGDGTPTSTGATPTHIYDTAGYYDICVTVTDSLGCTATFCDTAVYMTKNAGGTVELDVVMQIPTGIADIDNDELQISYYQGAFHFSSALAAPTRVSLYDMSGRKVIEQNGISGSVWQTSPAIASGAYLLHIENSSHSLSRKILILQ